MKDINETNSNEFQRIPTNYENETINKSMDIIFYKLVFIKMI
jgi:hypothetical protein|uniref:Uncharacterized protein n=1 Tax=viral metagenome TaxID=1070528 RepID=A0A6C0ILS6_9ZZZZ